VSFKRSNFVNVTAEKDRPISINCEEFQDILAMPLIEDCGGKGDWSRRGKEREEKEREERYPAVQLAGARGADTDDTGMVVDRDDRLPEEANKLNLLAEIYRNAGYRTWAQIAAEEQANASNASSANGLQPPTPFQTHTHSVVNPSAGNQTSDQRP
jgi:hypothetical protein